MLAKHGLYHEACDPAESYLALRDAILGLGRELGGDVWDIEALLWLLRPKKGSSRTGCRRSRSQRQAPTAATVPDVYVAYRDEELVFPDEIITTFLLSLWTKPFVILTGISGTGKTRIAQALAHALEPGTTDAPAALALEPGDEQHASFRITDWTLKSGRLYLGARPASGFRRARAGRFDEHRHLAPGWWQRHTAAQQHRSLGDDTRAPPSVFATHPCGAG